MTSDPRTRRGDRVGMLLRLPADMHATLELIAQQSGMSFNALIVGVLHYAIEENGDRVMPTGSRR